VCCGEAAEKMVTGTIVSVAGLIKVANDISGTSKAWPQQWTIVVNRDKVLAAGFV